MTVTYLFAAVFTKSKVKTTPGSAPTIDIGDANAPTGALLVSAATPTQLTNLTGYYIYAYTTATLTTIPIANFHTADATVDAQDLGSYPQVVLDANGNVLASVQAQANLDFGALQKTSLNAATPVVTLSSAGILAILNVLTTDVGIVANSFAAKLRDWVLGTDHKALISSDAQDLSATLSVNAKLLNGATPNNLAASAIVSGGAIGTSGGKVNEVTLVDTTTNLTNNTPEVGNVTLAASQPNYAPAKAGDAMDLVNAPNATALTAMALATDVRLSGVHGAGLWGGAAGSGFYTVPLTVTIGGLPASGVTVQVTADEAGNFIRAQAISNTNGIATVFLDPGDYWVFQSRGGDTFSPNPYPITVP